MKPIRFKEVNKTLTKPSDMTTSQCSSLPIASSGSHCFSCWGISLKERIKILFRGKIWLTVRSGETQPPVKLTIDKPFC